MFTQDINCLRWTGRHITSNLDKDDDLSWKEEDGRKKPLTIFDVGMNKGEFSLLYFKYFSSFETKIHAFEPNKFVKFSPDLNDFKHNLVLNQNAVFRCCRGTNFTVFRCCRGTNFTCSHET